jgi:hypothetical protein
VFFRSSSLFCFSIPKVKRWYGAYILGLLLVSMPDFEVKIYYNCMHIWERFKYLSCFLREETSQRHVQYGI